MSEFYIQRQLRIDDELMSEAEAIRRFPLLILLAEPGAGKTELLGHIARLLRAERVRASRFRAPAFIPPNTALVIDAIDEVARINELALSDLIEKARGASPSCVVFASRSGEWENSRTKFVEECFGRPAAIAHLRAFEPDEQRMLFHRWFPGEDFDRFQFEAASFDLSQLLGNPEFLNLLGLAYLENGRHFTSKSQIYSDATKRLAYDGNEGRANRGRVDAAQLAKHAGSVFARILLSGATGVSRTESLSDSEFPYLGLVAAEVPGGGDQLLDTKLFRPASDSDEHEPVHRIVAEYLAGSYLAARISDPGDTLSMRRCLAIIAPNGVVRDELRGMLGWMAATGDAPLQRAAIQVDPYAVLSNGDPSEITIGNRIFLVERLQEFADTDPYFRRSDLWRPFNVGRFFTGDMVDALRPLLRTRQYSQLRGLVLELLAGTALVNELSSELLIFVQDPSVPGHERIAAFRLLLRARCELADVPTSLISEGTASSLQMVAELITERGTESVGFVNVLSALRAMADLYKGDKRHVSKNTASRYFVGRLLQAFPVDSVPLFLDALTENISCSCAAKRPSQCGCYRGISRVAGGLIDRYFASSSDRHDPHRMWRWLRSLRFLKHIEPEKSRSVEALIGDAELRRNIQQLALAESRDADGRHDIVQTLYFGKRHAGLRFRDDDESLAAQWAFEQGDLELWGHLWRRHVHERNEKGTDLLRKRMRSHATADPAFRKAWHQKERGFRIWWVENRRDYRTRDRKYARREERQRDKIAEDLRQNGALIESGQHWGWLQRIANAYLLRPEHLDDTIDDPRLVDSALRNCFPFLMPHVPSLDELAKARKQQLVFVLHAACLRYYREHGNLNGLSHNVLTAVKTDPCSYSGVADEEAEHFRSELDRILFCSHDQVEAFLRAFIEPALRDGPDGHACVEWLVRYPIFRPLQATLPMEWLNRFPSMPPQAEVELFAQAVKCAPREELKSLIRERCSAYSLRQLAEPEPPAAARRKFWFLNSFFYDENDDIWEALKQDKDTLLDIASRMDRFGGEDGSKPSLSAPKIYAVLDAFVSVWPKVFLPNSYGTGDPPGEVAYRFLRDLAWRIGNDDSRQSVATVDRLLSDGRFAEFRNDLLAIRAGSARKLALHEFRAPSPANVSSLLERRSVASVEDLRALMLEALDAVESQIRHADTNTLEAFYPRGVRVDENPARNRVVELLRGYMTALRLSVVIEHHMAQNNRCDFTAAAMIDGARRLLTVEVKGQWHPDLFTAAASQLDQRYASHPDAARQGIYLVLWFGGEETVAGRKNADYRTPEDLRTAVVQAMPRELRGRIDTFVLDLSPANSPAQRRGGLLKRKGTRPVGVLSALAGNEDLAPWGFDGRKAIRVRDKKSAWPSSFA